MESPVFQNRLDLSELKTSADILRAEIAKVIVGQEKMVDYMMIAILAKGHVLLEGVPGIAKTLAARLVAKTIDTGFSRIQFTPDLMPSDIVGTSIFNIKNSEFEFKPGPVFSNIILIDEINRAPAKTQAALFELMEEEQVTVDGTTYLMQEPFVVFATQHPIDQEGTDKLPEAQLDRFIFKIEIGYPSIDEEVSIIDKHHQNPDLTVLENVNKILTPAKIAEYQQLIKMVHVEPHLIRYIAEIVNKTRNNNALFLGASPRASLAILNGSKAMAALNGRDFVKPEDIKELVYPVLNHRIILTPEKEMEGVSAKKVIDRLIETIEIPR